MYSTSAGGCSTRRETALCEAFTNMDRPTSSLDFSASLVETMLLIAAPRYETMHYNAIVARRE
jgi:hypothetical protein